jgi:probable HAF family extracellular repeat protein
MPSRLFQALSGIAFAMPLLAGAAAPPGLHFNITALPFPQLVHHISMNNAGDFAGYHSTVFPGGGGEYTGFWFDRNGTFRNLDFIDPTAQLILAAINDNGGVTGRLLPADGSAERAFFARTGGAPPVEIAPAPGMSSVTPDALSNTNAQGGWHVAGSGVTPEGYHAVRWTVDNTPAQNATMVDLGTLGGDQSMALDVNARGTVVGRADAANGEEHAFIHENGIMRNLDQVTGSGLTDSRAVAINEAGTVIGQTSDMGARAIIYGPDGVTYIGERGRGSTFANDINNHGWIAGQSIVNTRERGFVYIDGEMIYLDTLVGPSPGQIYNALAISDSNEILVYGCLLGWPGCNHFLLTPVPEPAAWALWLAGLPAVVAVSRRRARRRQEPTAA